MYMYIHVYIYGFYFFDMTMAAVGDTCEQVLQLPANSVWSVCCMSNGDIACGSRYVRESYGNHL